MRLKLLFAVAIAAVSHVISMGHADAQDDVPPPTVIERYSDPVYMSWLAQKKISVCVDCHTGPSAGTVVGGLSREMTEFSRRREVQRWLTSDKHTIARRRVEPYRADQEEAELRAMLDALQKQQDQAVENISRNFGVELDRAKLRPKSLPEDWMGDSNILSRRICDKLGYDVSDPSGYEAFRDNCLTCHGGYQSGDDGFTHAGKSQEQIGIDCLYCHQNGANTSWQLSHLDPGKWRLLPPADKTAAGMRNLVDTTVQASLCLDCHVGNRQRDMFVTHEMYAAGHPPLPSVELQTFCSEMPQHWQTPAELHQSLANDAGREQYFQTNYPGLVTASKSAGDILWNTRKVFVGALAARKQSLDLIVDSADAHQWADYSLYDCASCHHELRSDSQRQLRGFPAAPGRPRQHEWPGNLLKMAYRLAAGPGEKGAGVFQDLMQSETELTNSFGEQPFGEPETVRAAAASLRDQVVEATRNIERLDFSASLAEKILKFLAQSSKDDLLTYDAARQVVWAMQVIAGELQQHGAALPAELAAAVDSLGDPATTGIASALPSGRKQFIYPAGLADDLERRAAFDPSRLKAQLERVNRLLAASAASPSNGANLVSASEDL